MNPPLAENILAQVDALRAIRSHHFSSGREALVRAAELLRLSKRIILSGMGGSLFACIPLSYFFASRGVFAPVVETSELAHFYAASLDADTGVILVSRSGESVEATNLLTLLKQAHCKVIGVVNVPGSTLARNATQTVSVGSPADELVAIQTYIGTIVTLLLLGAAYFLDLYGAIKTELDASIEALSGWVPECFHWSGGWPSFFASAAPLYVLGRGASLASVGAGALLFHEVAKMPSVGMSAAQFRHGPVEVMNEQFRTVVFGSQAVSREIDYALAQDLMNANSNVRWIGPAMAHGRVPQLYSWPEGLPERFAPLAEIIPMQIAAFRTAQWLGIPLGRFRYAPMVTVSETGFNIPGPAS
ncbi:MAG TPA: SIS domain-containing protein [Bryobacteraceae bacterium]|nr:SIS domain-containing protein [Bryobacteraceae bacterium]